MKEGETKPSMSADLTDNEKDTAAMQEDVTTIDLPDVKDIPGQEHINVPPLGELRDVTISSVDEEGEGIWNEKDVDDDADVSQEEKELLRKSAEEMPNPDDDDLQQSFLDDKDEDGDPLNEKSSASNLSGTDLDIPGAELDDDNEEIGEEDEENNAYSQADTE